MAKRYELSDSDWERIEHLFPKGQVGRPPKWDDKIMFNAILCLARSGSAWEDIPSRYPPHQSVYSCFCKWRDDETLEAVFHALNADADMENLSIDSTYVKVHLQSVGVKRAINSEHHPLIGTSKGEKTQKYMPSLTH